MDTRTGEVYPSRQAALDAGVDPAFLVQVDPAKLADAFAAASSAPAGLRDRFKATVPIRFRMGRNDPCPCGSGKKFKKCCLNPAPRSLVAGAFHPAHTHRLSSKVPNYVDPPR